ncbi:MAG TPA: DUF2806 domain-containing protein [Candidatus Kapabacteria bacterium]|jgi:hypothetical protein|nr:DUF2806 domain-containing protein [Candidatus Kapabacteria bacterium]
MSEIESIATGVSEVSKASRKFMDVIISFFLPRRIRKQADAYKYAMEQVIPTASKHGVAIIKLEIGQEGLSIASAPLTSVNRAEMLSEARSERHQENFEAILQHAYKETLLLPEAEVYSEQPNSRWMDTFYEYAKNVDEEEVRRIWGKILSSEIHVPESFSLRTLDLLKNLSQKEANSFSELARLVFNRRFVYFDEGMLKRFGFSFDDILSLEAAGLLQRSVFFVAGEEELIKHRIVVYYGRRAFEVRLAYQKGSREASQYDVPAMPSLRLTAAGAELATLIKERNVKEYYELLHSFYRNNGLNPMDWSSSSGTPQDYEWAPIGPKVDNTSYW